MSAPQAPLRLALDRNLRWPSAVPYEHLTERLQAAGHPGLRPESSAADVLDALFDLQTSDAVTIEDQLAWDSLRLLEKRLVLDFFHYHLAPGMADLVGTLGQDARAPAPRAIEPWSGADRVEVPPVPAPVRLKKGAPM